MKFGFRSLLAPSLLFLCSHKNANGETLNSTNRTDFKSDDGLPRSRTTQPPTPILPHEGCLGLLNVNHKPQPKLVGEEYYEKNLDLHSLSLYSPEEEEKRTGGETSAQCIDGQAAGYPCNNVDLYSVLNLSELNESLPKSDYDNNANDIWGWTDKKSGREFAIIGLQRGTAFVEITDPARPVYKGALKTHGDQDNYNNIWRDIKTFKHYALIVSEIRDHGLQIFNLKNLLDDRKKVAYVETSHYSEFGNAHNIFVNEDTGFAYVVGNGSRGAGPCRGGLNFLDLSNPENPQNAGCYEDDGYTHDVQCVIYAGPDQEYKNKEICFASNEDTVTIIDVTNKDNPKQITRFQYQKAKYTHQGWLTEDHEYFIFDDELDEEKRGHLTKTYVLDVRNLSQPELVGIHSGRTKAIDHNLYVRDNAVFQANYRAGLNVLLIRDISRAEFDEIAYFDVYPSDNDGNFNGAWSNYPFFPSGMIVVSGIEQGLFVLKVTAKITSRPTMTPTQTLRPTRTASPTVFSLWELTEGGRSDCEITDNESCVTDGPGDYGSSEKCIYTAKKNMILEVDGIFVTEKSYADPYDYIEIRNEKYYTSNDGSNNFPKNLSLEKGETLTWFSDSSTEAKGYKICGRPLVCAGLNKSRCKKKGQCIFGNDKQIPICKAKSKKKETDCLSITTKNECLDKAYCKYLEFIGCKHKCIGLKKKRCKKELALGEKICKYKKKEINPCFGCQHVKKCSVPT